DGGAIADVHLCLIDIDAPIDTKNVAARGMQFAEKAAGSRSEVNNRNRRAADAFDERARVRLNIPDVIFRAQRANPTVEDLNGASARAHLHAGKIPEYVDQFAHKTPPHRFGRIHEALGFEKSFRWAAFNHVACESERRADEPHNRNSSG